MLAEVSRASNRRDGLARLQGDIREHRTTRPRRSVLRGGAAVREGRPRTDGPYRRGPPDLQRDREPRGHRRTHPLRRPGGRRPRRRRQQPGRHRCRGRQAGRSPAGCACAAPSRQGGAGHRLPGRLRVDARARVRRGRADGRRRVARPRPAPTLPRCARLRRRRARVAVRGDGQAAQLAAAPRAPVPRREPVLPGDARGRPLRHHGRLPGVPQLRARVRRVRGHDVAGLLLPDRDGVARLPARAADHRGPDHVHRAGGRRVEDEPRDRRRGRRLRDPLGDVPPDHLDLQLRCPGRRPVGRVRVGVPR